ncbi:MAG TPA: hypothetical protein VF293_04060, partial [Candidatus Limnocylindrales bacterium]
MSLLETIVGASLVMAVGWLLLVGFLWLHRPSRALAAVGLRLIPDLVRLVRALLADSSTPRSARL